MSVYRNDKSKYVRRAVESVTTEQTLKPDEVEVVVVDGPIPDGMANLIKGYEKAPDSISKLYGYRKIRDLAMLCE